MMNTDLDGTPKHEKTTIHDLHDYDLEHIFQYLTTAEERNTASEVCSRWKDIIHESTQSQNCLKIENCTINKKSSPWNLFETQSRRFSNIHFGKNIWCESDEKFLTFCEQVGKHTSTITIEFNFAMKMHKTICANLFLRFPSLKEIRFCTAGDMVRYVIPARVKVSIDLLIVLNEGAQNTYAWKLKEMNVMHLTVRTIRYMYDDWVDSNALIRYSEETKVHLRGLQDVLSSFVRLKPVNVLDRELTMDDIESLFYDRTEYMQDTFYRHLEMIRKSKRFAALELLPFDDSECFFLHKQIPLQNIEVLSILNYEGATQHCHTCMRFVGDSCTAIKKLGLVNFPHVHEILRPFARTIEGLELSEKLASTVSETFCEWPEMPNLREIVIMHMKLRKDSVEKVVEMCKNIEKAAFYGCGTTVAHLKVMDWPKLRHLEIYFDRYIDEASIVEAFKENNKKFSNLKSIIVKRLTSNLDFTGKFQEELVELFSKMPKLQRLNTLKRHRDVLNGKNYVFP